jgi:formamidopyrimidine-DNA glycosylase
MPELPEVETTLRGLQPFLEGAVLESVDVYVAQLRQPINKYFSKLLVGKCLTQMRRRNKYILAEVAGTSNTLLLHLGMSGRFTIFTGLNNLPPRAKHDHIIFKTAHAEVRYNDARRFGLALIIPTVEVANHPLLLKLGPEPLTDAFDGTALFKALQRRTTAIKPTLMDAAVVCGVGNIYASESLFRAGINPLKSSQNLSRKQAGVLVECIKTVLTEAIAAGGSTLRDYAQPDGQLGYFAHIFKVYGRKGQGCLVCKTPVVQVVQAQRSTFYCPSCQPG